MNSYLRYTCAQFERLPTSVEIRLHLKGNCFTFHRSYKMVRKCCFRLNLNYTCRSLKLSNWKLVKISWCQDAPDAMVGLFKSPCRLKRLWKLPKVSKESLTAYLIRIYSFGSAWTATSFTGRYLLHWTLYAGNSYKLKFLKYFLLILAIW